MEEKAVKSANLILHKPHDGKNKRHTGKLDAVLNYNNS